MRMLTGLVSIVALATASCLSSATQGGGGGGGPTVSDACRAADLGASDTARSFAAFMQASGAFADAANDIDARLLAGCRSLGVDLGMSAGEIDAQGGSTLGVCGQVSARIKVELAAVAAAQVKVRVETTEPVCVTHVEEYRRCIERCDTRVVSAGRVEYRCEGGELRGRCGATCTGGCAAQASGSCAGACEGTCSGGCAGTCDGICEGECSARDSDGTCRGTCRGTCHGTCSAGCAGTCQGRCVAAASASCQGECRGGCSIEFEQPICTGRIIPPEVRTECREVCDDYQISRRECTPGETRMIIDAGAVAEAAERARRVGNALAARLPAIHALTHRLLDLRRAGESLASNAAGFASGVASLGGQALLCGAQASAALPRAIGQISVAFEVSITISASVSASGG